MTAKSDPWALLGVVSRPSPKYIFILGLQIICSEYIFIDVSNNDGIFFILMLHYLGLSLVLAHRDVVRIKWDIPY